MLPTGFTNSFTSGEICEDAWDRTDIQPIAKGCAQATNLMVQVTGPLAKRRGFWRNGSTNNPAKLGRLIPFRRSISDALMLEFGDEAVWVWSADGSPLLNGGVQVTFASPYTQAQLAGLRYKQVADVIYFRHSSGLQPQALARTSDTSWAFAAESFPNGPWLGENITAAKTVTVTSTGGPGSETDALTGLTGAILVGSTVSLVATDPIFAAGQIGSSFRLRAGDGTSSATSWAPGTKYVAGDFALSVGHVYKCTSTYTGGVSAISTPPVQLSGTQSDGGNVWDYRHDGAGVVQITAVADATHATGTVLNACPFFSPTTTSYYSENAYSAHRGWPRMWPSVAEERLVNGGTANNLDIIDLTEIAGYSPTFENYQPGLGTGLVDDTDALRRRLGDTGAAAVWSSVAPFLLIGTSDGEFIVSGGLFGEPMTPSTVAVRQVSAYGSEDVGSTKGDKGVFFVCRGGQTLRKLVVDLQQNSEAADMSFLATHIASRTFVQLAWLPQPDFALWARLADGGVAVMTDHEEQAVRGWTRQAINGGFLVEDIVTLPGPGRQETLWMIVSRAGAREIWMQSQVSDALFVDRAASYAGAPVATIGGLGHMAGETARVLANGVQLPDQAVSGGGTVAVPAGTTAAQVGLAYQTAFTSLKLDMATLGGTLMERQRITQITSDLRTAGCTVGFEGGLSETVRPVLPPATPAASAQRILQQTTAAGDTSRDPRVVINEDTGYNHVIYAIKPQVSGRG